MNGYLVRRILQKGERHRGRFFDVLSKSAAHGGQTTVICSTKVSKRAVIRNAVRRKIKEIIRLRRKDGSFEQTHIVVIVKHPALEVSYCHLLEEFNRII